MANVICALNRRILITFVLVLRVTAINSAEYTECVSRGTSGRWTDVPMNLEMIFSRRELSIAHSIISEFQLIKKQRIALRNTSDFARINSTGFYFVAQL